jgi:protein TonB
VSALPAPTSGDVDLRATDRAYDKRRSSGDRARWIFALALSLLAHGGIIAVAVGPWLGELLQEKGVAGGPSDAITVTLVAPSVLPAPVVTVPTPPRSAPPADSAAEPGAVAPPETPFSTDPAAASPPAGPLASSETPQAAAAPSVIAAPSADAAATADPSGGGLAQPNHSTDPEVAAPSDLAPAEDQSVFATDGTTGATGPTDAQPVASAAPAQSNPQPPAPPRVTPSKPSSQGTQAVTAPGGGDPQRQAVGPSGASVLSNYQGEVLARIRQQAAEASGRVASDGTSFVIFEIQAAGGISGMRLAQSSGVAALDQLALDIVKRAAPFPPIPAQLDKQSLLFDVPVNFKTR